MLSIFSMFSNNQTIFILLFILHTTQTYYVQCQLISIKPGGLRGFYMLGISKYIKTHYDLSKYSFYGASAGAWNSLYLSKKTEDTKIEPFLKTLDTTQLKSLFELEENLQNYYLTNYNASDFNLDKLNICVSVLQNYKLKKQMFSKFRTLEDAMQCCIASSHIPYITRRTLYYPYKTHLCIDGGFFPNPHHDHQTPTLLIAPDMWQNEKTSKHNALTHIENINIAQMIHLGYEDAKTHKQELDNALLI